MPNREQINILNKGVHQWNQWRAKNWDIQIDLSGAKLIDMNLEGADLLKADLRFASFNGSILRKSNLKAANLSGANFSSVDLVDADLSYIYAPNTKFILANMTGACIRTPYFDSDTRFDGVKCRYVYCDYDYNNDVFIDRHPTSPDQNFDVDEFEGWIKSKSCVLKVVNITFLDGINWNAFLKAFQEICIEYAYSFLILKSIRMEGSKFIVSFDITNYIQENIIQSYFMEAYNTQVQLIEGLEGKRFTHDMSDILYLLADRRINNTFKNKYLKNNESINLYKSIEEIKSKDHERSSKPNLLMVFSSWFQHGQAFVTITAFIFGILSTYFLPRLFPDNFFPVDTNASPDQFQKSPDLP